MTSAPPTVVYDACVLYPAPLRDLLMWLALSSLCHARWTGRIQDEWKTELLRHRPDLTKSRLDRTSGLMNAALPDALVMDYEYLIDALLLPDPNDRHVLAAAIHCGASVIVTCNKRDFPPSSLLQYGIEAQHPDEFIEDMIGIDPGAVVAAAKSQRAHLNAPRIEADHFLAILRKQGLVQTCKFLENYLAVL
jgi:hypothetical protein